MEGTASAVPALHQVVEESLTEGVPHPDFRVSDKPAADDRQKELHHHAPDKQSDKEPEVICRLRGHPVNQQLADVYKEQRDPDVQGPDSHASQQGQAMPPRSVPKPTKCIHR